MKDIEIQLARLQQENEELRLRLQEYQETLSAIQNGQVDALVVGGPRGDQVFSLKDADHSYRVLIEEMQEGAVTLAEDGSILYANKFIERVLEIPLEKIIGANIEKFLHPSDIDIFEASLKMCRHVRSSTEIRFKTGNDATLPAYLSFSCITLENVPVICLAVTDLTEQKRHERILAEEQLSRSIIEQSADAIIVCDEKGTVIRASRVANELAGQNSLNASFDAVFKIKTSSGKYSQGGKPISLEPFTIDSVINGNRYHSCEAVIERNGIPANHLLLSAAPLKDEPGNVLGGIVNLADISDKIRLEQLREELYHSQKMKAIGTLAGGIAHDFNNILGIIIGNTELAMLDIPNWSPVQESLKEIRSAGLRASDLVNQILLFARQKEHTVPAVHVEPIARESLKMLRASIPTTVEIRLEIQEDLPNVVADSTQIQQIIMNLCTNAGHVMESDGGTLTFGLDQAELNAATDTLAGRIPEGRYVRIQVRDTGPGIPPENLERIFEPFFTTKSVGEGTGLGLAVVHGIVQDRSGGITVESEAGKGTVFNVLLPVSDHVPSEEETRDKKPDLPGGKERILFVDDEPMIMKLGQRMLERQGYKVETRASGKEALECFKQNPGRFDLVVTDMTMPGMRGDHLARELMAIRPGIPIILTTGYSKLISEEKAKALGIRGFVMKPLTTLELAKTVRKVLDSKT